MSAATLFEQIIAIHTDYNKKVHSLIAPLDAKRQVTVTDKIDRVAFHVIEEIVEMRRTYPHKFWKKSPENFDPHALLEEAADIFLMSRSMYLEICEVCGITEEDFLKAVLDKAKINQERIDNGY